MKNFVGLKFGRLSVIEEVDRLSKYRRRFKCLCECGNVSYVSSSNLASGHTLSCGCLHKEKFKGLSKYKNTSYNSITYTSYYCMLLRTQKEYHESYDQYKTRKVCKSWLESYDNFYKDMGERPSKKYSLDRIDNNLGYFKENCRWATQEEQQNNTSTNVILTYKGETSTMSLLCRKHKVSYELIRGRLRLGWNINKAFETPKLR